MAISNTRRRILQAAGLAGASLAAYSYHRGIRFPSIAWEPPAIAKKWSLGNSDLNIEDLIASKIGKDTGVFRAFAPEPEIAIRSRSAQLINLTIRNIFPEAQLVSSADTQIDERIDGINRFLTITTKAESEIKLHWQLPNLGSYKFAAIGDTGGGKELAWCIHRAKQLGASFLLHLGDFNYQAGDYASTISLLNDAPLPCFVSMGNHDFHDKGMVYHQFLSEIGPFNNQFSIGKTRFINIDTAANILPYAAGHRGNLMQTAIAQRDAYADTVAFTHRPLHDPLENSTHDIGSSGERDWLVKKLTQANIKTLLSGHIHIFDRRSVFGIDNIIVGQGLGHQDLLTNSDYSKMALGVVAEDGKVSFQFPGLAMPMDMHCHPRTEPVKKELRKGSYAQLISDIDKACGK